MRPPLVHVFDEYCRTMTPALPSAILDQLESASTRPRLTWYDSDGRIELSGHVVANWAVKTTNLLVEELDVEPGARVVLDLPTHWRALVWSLAAWRAGATVVVSPDDRSRLTEPDLRPDDVVVTDEPGRWTQSRSHLVAVALHALARRFDGELPPRALDAASSVMTYSDRLGFVPATEEGEVALEVLGGPRVTYAELPDRLEQLASRGGSGTDASASTRALLPVGAGALVTLLATAATLWSADGSLVVVPSDLARDRVERISADERTTARLGDAV